MNTLKYTELYKEHVSLGAYLGNFGPWVMPLYYKEHGAIKEHSHTRNKACLFDTSHMGHVIISGKDACRFLSYITPSDFSVVENNSCKYTVINNIDCNIIDDIIVNKVTKDRYHLVLNALTKQSDIEYLCANSSNFDITIEEKEYSMICIQGPMSQEIMNNIASINTLPQKRFKFLVSDELLIAATGYTGERGFEFIGNSQSILSLWKEILKNKDVIPAGIIARNSLRMEAGFPLYGCDITDETNIFEANLAFVCDDNAYNIANKALQAQRHLFLKDADALVRVYIVTNKNHMIRDRQTIFTSHDTEVGVVNLNGSYSPILGKNIMQGYVKKSQLQEGVFYTYKNKKKIPLAIYAKPILGMIKNHTILTS